eukprot:COSAG06_NODE_66651_length_254_cov_0.329032_2_plen_47_part_01
MHWALAEVFFNDTATPEIYTLSYTLALHDALPVASLVSFMASMAFLM